MTRIALASDHGGYDLKEAVKKHLEERGFETVDLGTDSAAVSVDYPKYGELCGRCVTAGVTLENGETVKADLGVVCCGTGIGISMAANKVPGVRCGLCTDTYMATMTKRHNNANILAMGGRVLTVDEALPIVDAWLDTEFEGGRHERRVNMLDAMR